ncbi:MAG: CvpA family protein [Kiritimatiellae bacterium]|nr:CvpA family protein [Kiritimatiellia bacterium]
MPEWLQNCSILDYLIIAVALFLVIRGFFRGCSGEIGQLLGIVAATFAVFLCRAPVSSAVSACPSLNNNPFACSLLSALAILVVGIVAWLLVGRVCAKLISLAVPQPLNAILGGIIGLLKVFLLVCMLCHLGIIGSTEKSGEETPLQRWSVLVDKVTPWIKPLSTPSEP